MTDQQVAAPHFVRTLVVAEVIKEIDDAHTLVFAEPADADHFGYRPGQFLTLSIPSDLEPTARCYSLCSSPETDQRLAVTVKRTAGGYASNWICDNVVAGTRLHALAPSGTFVPPSLDGHLLLCAAGSGITPMLSIIKTVLAGGDGRITLLYANRDERSVIFAATLRDLVAAHPDRLRVVHWLESVQGLPRADAIAHLVPAGTDSAWLCGPTPFMTAVTKGLIAAGWDPTAIHQERFHSITGDPFAAVAPIAATPDAAQVTIDLDGETHQLDWPQQESLLDVMLAAGLDAPFSCKEGSCSACACFLREGEAEMVVNDILEQEDLDAGQVLACQLRPRSAKLRIDYG